MKPVPQSLPQKDKKQLGGLFVGNNLAEHWQEWLENFIFSRNMGVLLVATAEQRDYIREAMLQKGGSWGWEVVTLGQIARRQGVWGADDLAIVGKSHIEEALWPQIDVWAREFCSWRNAGYAKVEYARQWSEIGEKLEALFEKLSLKELIRKTPRVVADVALGFHPLQVHPSWSINTWGLVSEGVMSSAEMTMVEALEKKWGEKIICGDNRGTREILRLRLNAPTELTSGIREALSKNPKIKRILYQDSVAVAAALRLEDVLPGRKASIENIAEREFCESLKKLQENRSNFFEKLLFARSAVSFGVLSAEEVEKELSTAKKRWQKEQTLRGLEEVVGEGFFLPERATLDSLFEYTKGVFSDAAEKLMKRFSLIKNYLPKAGIPSKLWLGELRFSAIEEACLYDLRLIDFERAAGLMDDESLAVFSSTPSNSIETICDAAAQKELNRREFAEGAMPQKGYLELDPHTRILKRFHLAERLCSGIALENFVFQDTELAKKFEKRIYKKHCLFLNKNLPELWQAEEIKVLIKKHGEKNNPDLAFGENDNALDAVTSFTCRVWESLIKEPELAWYEVLKLQPLWTVEKSDASALWIGIWAHEALAQAKDDSSINAYFSLARLAQKDVFTVKAAWMSAWRLASSLWAKIKEVKTIAAEEEVEGFLEVKNVKIPLRGRIDRVVEDSSGRFLLLDFKKSSQPVSLKTLAEGDGLQLLLYARLFRKVQVGALCRLSPKDSLKPQATIDKELFECEKEMARIVATGILGARGEVWGRFGDEDRLPLASIPLSPKIINARRRKSGEEKR